MRRYIRRYRSIDLDSPAAARAVAERLRTKQCLRDIYVEMYKFALQLRERFLVTGGRVLEIGSGGGFIKDLFPEIITSDVRKTQYIDLKLDAQTLPFEDNSLDAIISVFALHHLQDVESFLREANRALKPGGGIICFETYWGPVARLLYGTVHPEPFDSKAITWRVEGKGPLTQSNQALSYLLMKRDKDRFQSLFPGFTVVYRKRFGFIRYLMTGGVWLDSKGPDWLFPALKFLEYLLTPLMPLIAIHHVFVWKKMR